MVQKYNVINSIFYITIFPQWETGSSYFLKKKSIEIVFNIINIITLFSRTIFTRNCKYIFIFLVLHIPTAIGCRSSRVWWRERRRVMSYEAQLEVQRCRNLLKCSGTNTRSSSCSRYRRVPEYSDTNVCTHHHLKVHIVLNCRLHVHEANSTWIVHIVQNCTCTYS